MGILKPCSACYAARQQAKMQIRAALGLKSYAYMKLTTTRGWLIVNNENGRVLAAEPDREDRAVIDWSHFLGLQIYVAGTSIVDVAKAARVDDLGRIVSKAEADNLGAF